METRQASLLFNEKCTHMYIVFDQTLMSNCYNALCILVSQTEYMTIGLHLNRHIALTIAVKRVSQCDVILSHWVCRKIGSLPNTKIKSNKTSKSGSNVLGLVHTWTLLKLNLIRLQSHHTKGSDMSPIWFQINKTDSLPNKTLSSFSCLFQRLDTTRIIR